MTRKKIGQLLVEASMLTQTQLDTALREQAKWGGKLGLKLVELRMISEQELVSVLSQQLKISSITLSDVVIPPKVVALVPLEIAQRDGLMPFRVDSKFLDVAMVDPTNTGSLEELRMRTQLNIRPYISGPHQMEKAIAHYYGTDIASITVSFDEDLGEFEFDSPAKTRARFTLEGNTNSRRKRSPRTTKELTTDLLHKRVADLEERVHSCEDAMRKLLGVLSEKGVTLRDDIIKVLDE